MKRCYFCGAKAPEMMKNKGVYILECGCGMKVADYSKENVLDLWNYDANVR